MRLHGCRMRSKSCQRNGHIHTNGLENFWSLLKRTIKGTYVHCESFHLVRYLDEQAYRFNERSKDDAGRFIGAMGGLFNRRLTYCELTGENSLMRGIYLTIL